MEPFAKKFEVIMSMRLSLNRESDRGAVLLSVSFLEKEIENLLGDYFVKNEKIRSSIFTGYGALATFSAKIDLSFLLGLISKQTLDDLNCIRKIRNEFAHSHFSIDFTNDKVKNLCLNLKTNFRKDRPARVVFTTTIFGILIRILSCEYTTISEYYDKISIERLNEGVVSSQAKLHENLEEFKKMLDVTYAGYPNKRELIEQAVNDYIHDLHTALVDIAKKTSP
jgi:DNA-binding MltR family transcriptional regulator